MEIIPIGQACSVAYNASLLGYRLQAYPFDWLRIDYLDQVSTLIKNNFDSFFDQLSINTHSVSSKFPWSDNDDFPKNGAGISQIVQNKMGLSFCHDFNNSRSIDEQIDTIKEKYDRRIKRLYKMLNNHNWIHFIRDEITLSHINDQSISNFMSVVNTLTTNYHVTIILHNSKNQKISIKPHPNLTIVNDVLPFGSWKRPNVDWKNIF